jgi:3-oxoacyl-[acyl-carrier-protein] synthase-3
MNLPKAVAIDIGAACTGFITGLSIARAFVESGIYRNIVVVGVEKLSTLTNYSDRNTCVLFGDGAGAAVVTPASNGSGILSSYIKSDGSMREWLWVPSGGSTSPIREGFPFDESDKIRMAGSEVFKVAVREMSNAALRVIEDAGLKPEDVSLVVPHQANIRIIEAIAKRLKIRDDRIVLNIANYGNTSAASIPIALDEANRAGRLHPGDTVLMVAFGGGMIWGAALVRW